MEQYSGKAICQGIAIGVIRKYENEKNLVKRSKIANVEDELTRYQLASSRAIVELRNLRY
ncbi:MAG: hypothetical protein HGA25_11495 [Clostridiales bacterium]|nr:hypothetical protein [Clostridiales bacterium]